MIENYIKKRYKINKTLNIFKKKKKISLLRSILYKYNNINLIINNFFFQFIFFFLIDIYLRIT